MASIRAVHDAKHHQNVVTSMPSHVTSAIETLLSAYTVIKEEYNQFLVAYPAPSCSSTPKLGDLFERLAAPVEQLASALANSPTKAVRRSTNTTSPKSAVPHSAPVTAEYFPMPSFIPTRGTDFPQHHPHEGTFSVGTPSNAQHHAAGPGHVPGISVSANCSAGNEVSSRSADMSLASESLRVQNQLKHGEDGAGFATLNSYIVVNEIGDGTTAKVLQVCDTLTSQMFAIKRVKRGATIEHLNTLSEIQELSSCKTHRPSDNTTTKDLPFLQDSTEYNFRKEIAIMKKLKHPNLVKLHEVIDDKSADHVYLVMDFVQGGPLLEIDDKVNTVKHPEEHFFSPRVVRAQFRCIANAIHYLHRHGIAHLDIKPENILLDEHGDPIIIDFGVAHHHHARGEGSPTKFGTPYFFSPEQCEGVPANEMDLFAADIWALGVTLYTMLFHKLPFHADSYFMLRDSIQNDDLVLPKDCDSDARNLLTSMLCKDPKQRITVKELCRHPFVKKSSRRRPGDLPGGRRRSVAFSGGSLRDGSSGVPSSTHTDFKTRVSGLNVRFSHQESPPDSAIVPTNTVAPNSRRVSMARTLSGNISITSFKSAFSTSHSTMPDGHPHQDGPSALLNFPRIPLPTFFEDLCADDGDGCDGDDDYEDDGGTNVLELTKDDIDNAIFLGAVAL